MKEPYPPVGRMRMALYQRQRLELVDDAAKRDRLDVQQLRQTALVDAFVLRQIGQHLPLRTRQAGAARVLLEASPEQSRDIVQQKPKCRGIRFHGGSIRKQAYDQLCLVFFNDSELLLTRLGRQRQITFHHDFSSNATCDLNSAG